ncbi:YqgE/AlgH family protein [Cellulomonas oligotrophica]|nr:YqgE/AlgH family protein [Cellulomonas oligotrophica]NYD85779.1 putative transcriptional regulator [Cellulomonas oligotrophica]
MVGRLLVARPRLVDPHFGRSVVLVLDHGDHGTLGVVLDRPMPVPVDRVLPPWHDRVARPATLFQGGPVGLDSAMGVAVLDPALPPPRGVHRVVGPFGLVDLDADPDVVLRGVVGVRIFAGHAGWGAGQLAAELAERSWFVLASRASDVLTPTADGLWRHVMRRQGGDLALLSTSPADARLN